MSSTGDKHLISRIEEIDLAFSSLWSNNLNLECGTLFFNPDLPNDLFFNKLTNITCISDKMINDALTFFKKYGNNPYICILDYKELEQKLVEKGFILHDVQHVLKLDPVANIDVRITSEMKKISLRDSMVWSRTFCDAYDCIEWVLTVDKIVKKTCQSIEYYEKSMSSCVALYEKNSVLGLYCLGTIPKMRKKGFAKSLIKFALTEVNRRKLDFLMLETYERDNLLEFYSSLGFREIFQKKIYTI